MALRDNDIMKQLSRTAVLEGKLMLKLTEKTISEARTVKIIALVTLIFIPASFTSVRWCNFLFPELWNLFRMRIPSNFPFPIFLLLPSKNEVLFLLPLI